MSKFYYFKNRYQSRNKFTRKYNCLIQMLIFGRKRCEEWWEQEHQYHNLLRYHYSRYMWRNYSFKQIEAITLSRYDTPLSNRKFNVIKQMEHASTRSHNQGIALMNYLNSKVVLSRLLENRTDKVTKLYLFKPLIALKNSHLHYTMGGALICDKLWQPTLDMIKLGKQKLTSVINRRKNGIQILTLNTEFKPNIKSMEEQRTAINVHAQGLGVTTTKFDYNEQRHVEAMIGKLFAEATGYKQSKPYYKNGKLTYTNGDFLVQCPKFTLRNNRYDNRAMTLSYLDNSECQEKYPLLNKQRPTFTNKWIEITKYNYYTGKQYKAPVLSKVRHKAKNAYIKFKNWKFNKMFIEACNNSVHRNLKWGLQFNQRTKSNQKKIKRLKQQHHEQQQIQHCANNYLQLPKEQLPHSKQIIKQSLLSKVINKKELHKVENNILLKPWNYNLDNNEYTAIYRKLKTGKATATATNNIKHITYKVTKRSNFNKLISFTNELNDYLIDSRGYSYYFHIKNHHSDYMANLILKTAHKVLVKKYHHYLTDVTNLRWQAVKLAYKKEIQKIENYLANSRIYKRQVRLNSHKLNKENRQFITPELTNQYNYQIPTKINNLIDNSNNCVTSNSKLKSVLIIDNYLVNPTISLILQNKFSIGVIPFSKRSSGIPPPFKIEE